MTGIIDHCGTKGAIDSRDDLTKSLLKLCACRASEVKQWQSCASPALPAFPLIHRVQVEVRRGVSLLRVYGISVEKERERERERERARARARARAKARERERGVCIIYIYIYIYIYIFLKIKTYFMRQQRRITANFGSRDERCMWRVL